MSPVPNDKNLNPPFSTQTRVYSLKQIKDYLAQIGAQKDSQIKKLQRKIIEINADLLKSDFENKKTDINKPRTLKVSHFSKSREGS